MADSVRIWKEQVSILLDGGKRKKCKKGYPVMQARLNSAPDFNYFVRSSNREKSVSVYY
jgi:hypothetical protein